MITIGNSFVLIMKHFRLQRGSSFPRNYGKYRLETKVSKMVAVKRFMLKDNRGEAISLMILMVHVLAVLVGMTTEFYYTNLSK